MKQIKPVKVWFKDGLKDLDAIKVTSVFDNLTDYVKFEFTLFTDGEAAGGGSVALEGADNYIVWDASASGAYQIVAIHAGVELLDNPNTWMKAPE